MQGTLAAILSHSVPGFRHFTSQSEGRVAGGDVGPRRPPARNACYDEPALPAGGADLMRQNRWAPEQIERASQNTHSSWMKAST